MWAGISQTELLLPNVGASRSGTFAPAAPGACAPQAARYSITNFRPFAKVRTGLVLSVPSATDWRT